MTAPQFNIVMVAGETSGDTLGAELITRLQAHPSHSFHFSGMGGERMRAAGMECIVDHRDLDIVGFIEVIKQFRQIKAAFRTLQAHLQDTRPDLVILIDYPGFNLRLARAAKQCGATVLYYVSPQIWAWRYRRIKTIKAHVDHMAVLFPFEKTLYDQENVPCDYVGHPLVAQTLAPYEKAAELLSSTPQPVTVALLPGSRRSEIERHLPVMVKTAERLLTYFPDLKFILIKARHVDDELIAPYLTATPINVVTEDQHTALAQARCAICTSGTITLETALLGVPHVIIYRTHPINYWIAQRLVRTEHIGLSNIMAERTIAPELIQHEAHEDRITKLVLPLLTHVRHYRLVCDQLRLIRQRFGEHHHADNAANLACRLLNIDPITTDHAPAE